MTTIAFREGILAADVEVTGNGSAWATTSKIFGTPFAMAGVSGNIADIALFQSWFDKNCHLWTHELALPTLAFIADGPGSKTPNDCEAILVFANGCIYSWQGTPFLKSIGLCRTFIGGLLPAEQPGYVAIGSGEKYAMAAMACGMPAESAVHVACRMQGFSAMQRNEAVSFDIIAASGAKLYGMNAQDNRPPMPTQAPDTEAQDPFPPRPETIQ